MHELLIENVRLADHAAVNVLIRDGRIVEIGMPVAGPGAEHLAGEGALALPGFVDAHTHLDKTLWGMGWRGHSAGPRLIDKIENERRVRREQGIDPARQSARLAAHLLAMGTTHIRSHVDVDTEVGVAGIEGVIATRERLAALVSVELVAFPQSGLLIRPGTLALLDRAIALGADVVGGLDPCAIDRDPKGHLDAIFALAQKYGRPIDIHLHEPGDMGAFSLEEIIARTRALGMQGKVTVSHAFCLGMLEAHRLRPLLADMARERIAVMTTGTSSGAVPPVAACWEAGVTVCSGSDGIRDCWTPYGTGDMLERAALIGLRNGLRSDAEIIRALEACSSGGAKVMGIADYGLAVGSRADLVLVPGETVSEAVVAHPPARTVIANGRIVARDGALTEVATPFVAACT